VIIQAKINMVEEVKISLIGAGSLTFTPALIKAVCESELAKECKVILDLFDVDLKALETSYGVSNKVAEYYKKSRKDVNLEIRKSLGRKESFENTDFAILTIGVGGVQATLMDGEIPFEYNVFQSVADTVGPGGLMRCIRHVPVVVEMAKELQDISPKATIINYSNPMTPLTRAIQRESKIRVYGLCTGIFGCVNFLSNFLEVNREKLSILEAGINHFTWITKLGVPEGDGYPLLEKMFNKKGLPTGNRSIVSFELYKLFGLFPVAGDRHVAEFFPSIFMNEKMMQKYKIPSFPDGTVYSPERRKPVEDILIKAFEGKIRIETFLQQEFLEKEGMEAITLIESIIFNKKNFFVGINVQNDGCISSVPSWAVVEVPAYIDASGVHPINVGSLPKSILGIINKRVFWYEIGIDAALTYDRNLAIQALLLDGYVNSLDLARELLNRLLEKEKNWLPSGWFKQ
jgi:alpha-galactosidase